MMNRYHKRFLESFTSDNVIALFSRYKNSAKEITESWGMLEAAKKFVPNLNDCRVVVVGDGASPRTGAIFAYYTKTNVISIDPCFNIAHWKDFVEKQTNMGFPPQRLYLIKSKVENVNFDCLGNERVVVVWPHSHAPMDKCIIKKVKERYDIALPCCVQIPKKFIEKPHITYVDYNIESPRNTVHIWVNI